MNFLNRYCTKEHANTLQAEILQHGMLSNCEIYIINLRSKPVPVIYATMDIMENEYLCLSKQNIAKLNESFVSWNSISAGNLLFTIYARKTKKIVKCFVFIESTRRSTRLPYRSKAFEEQYDANIISKKHDGLEVKINKLNHL